MARRRFSVDDSEQGLSITIPPHRGLLVVTLLIGFFDAVALMANLPLWGLALAAVVLLPLTYLGLCLAVNRRELRITGSTMTISVGPLPWASETRLDLREVSDFYFLDQKSRDSDGDFVNFRYLYYKTTDGRTAPLNIGSLDDDELADLCALLAKHRARVHLQSA